ncbi:bile acid:sodium symporter [Micrococcales bacterium 31B]|nr:bile acid:sodium symporter [Micrococcales bacterium 31B]
MRRLDGFLILLVLTVVIATLLPARGSMAPIMDGASTAGIFLLFFLYGARLPTREAIAALKEWRLHGVTLAITFLLFPLLGLLALLIPDTLMHADLRLGLLFLTLLPSTVQSSIALTSLAGGNVPAAICSASFSNLLGVVVTPLLVTIYMHADAGINASSVLNIVTQLLVPFVLGQLLQRWIGPFIKRHTILTKIVDRGSILLVVYTAFSHGVVAGIWSRTPWVQIVLVGVACCVLLALALSISALIARWCGFTLPDRIVVLFCGSKKSMASGLPIANVLLPAASVSVMILPLMLFHQIQLMVCAVIARRLAKAPRD